MEKTVFTNKFIAGSAGRNLQGSINRLEDIITNYEEEQALFMAPIEDEKLQIGVYKEEDCMNINGTEYYKLQPSVLYGSLDEIVLAHIKKRLSQLRKKREKELIDYSTLINS